VKGENEWLADAIKGNLFPAAEFWSNSRVILNMRCNSVKVQESSLAGERNERNIFWKKFEVTGISDQMSRL